IAAARAERTRPADAAVGLVGDVVLLEEGRLRPPLDSVADGSELVRVRSREAVTQRDVAVRRHPEQPQARAARIRLADAFVNFLQRILHVRESVMAIFDDMSEKIRRERAELIEHAIEAALADRVLLIRRRGHGREADFPEPEI